MFRPHILSRPVQHHTPPVGESDAHRVNELRRFVPTCTSTARNPTSRSRAHTHHHFHTSRDIPGDTRHTCSPYQSTTTHSLASPTAHAARNTSPAAHAPAIHSSPAAAHRARHPVPRHSLNTQQRIAGPPPPATAPSAANASPAPSSHHFPPMIPLTPCPPAARRAHPPDARPAPSARRTRPATSRHPSRPSRSTIRRSLASRASCIPRPRARFVFQLLVPHPNHGPSPPIRHAPARYRTTLPPSQPAQPSTIPPNPRHTPHITPPRAKPA